MRNRKGSYLFCASILIFLIFLSGCASMDIQKLNIEDINIEVINIEGQYVDQIVPGQDYLIDISIISDGQHIVNIDYRDIIITSQNRTFEIIEHTKKSIVVRATNDYFRMLDFDEYKIELFIKNNRYNIDPLSFKTDITQPLILNFKGRDGRSGSSGNRGANAKGDSLNSLNGKNGSKGSNGFSGYNGLTKSFVIFHYEITDGSLAVAILDRDNNRIYLSSSEKIVIDTSGGLGGPGGSGGNGGKAAQIIIVDPDTSEKLLYIGKVGKAGRGGNGGDGGRGGNITLLSSSEKSIDYIEVITEGGKGGLSGKDGLTRYNDKGFYGVVTYSSSRGVDGIDGIFVQEYISELGFMLLLKNIDSEYFNIDRVVLKK